MPDPRQLVYFNGRIVPVDEARLPLDDRGVLYGLGFFETFRTSGGRPHHWSYHQRRLAAACAVARLALPPMGLARNEARLRETVTALLRAHSFVDAVFRYTVTGGAGGVPSEFLTLRPLPAEPPAEGIRLRVLQLARDSGEWLPRPKSLNYANALLGADELAARSTGPGDEGLFLARDGGCVVETPRQNLAWIAGGRLCYPDPALGAIAGTCLAWLLTHGGQPAEPRRASLGDLLSAEAVLVLNAVRGLTPVREIWDAGDRGVLRSFASAHHPVVQDFRSRWAGALRVTAAA